VELPATLLGECGKVLTESRAAFDRGFDARATRQAEGTITGVDPAGPAYAAGMRDGMKLVRREGSAANDSTLPLAYRIADADGEKLISYLPIGRTRHAVQRIAIGAANEEAKAACKNRLGGTP
jgi:predicted metalloprotease with PDZ domain